VDKLFFVGSVASGRKVAEACARRLVPCVLELGGSDPAIVCADADVAHAARGVVWGRFVNAGQTCTAPKRVYVDAAVYEPFVAAVAAAVRALQVGPGSAPASDVGPLIRPAQAEQLRAQLDDALAGGARVLAEAPLPDDLPAAARGGYFAPTVLGDVRPDARVLHEETFGPLLPVVKVRDADEAVRLANGSAFGLSASVWTRDARRARAIAARLDAGTVAINDSVFVAGMAEVPHGGVKESGIGRSHGVAGLLECVRTKAVVTDLFAGWAQPWWFGGSAAARAAAVDDFARLAHGRGVGERLRGIPGTLRLLRRRD
jgi:succinate-semialdehyde dehydrogenase/glutarate-semialdehyde dehydrogenase